MLQQPPRVHVSSGIKTDPAQRILLIEDNDLNRELLGEYLIYLGYQVFSLADGSEFFSTLSTFQPHLILLDLKLPDIDGYTLLQQLKHDSQWQDLPVIVVSALASQADQQKALSLGARRYFVKPVNLSLLQQAIQEEFHPLIY